MIVPGADDIVTDAFRCHGAAKKAEILPALLQYKSGCE